MQLNLSSLLNFAVSCGPPSTITNGYIIPSYTSTREGEQVNVTCLSESQRQENYTVPMTCNHEGSWQPNLTDICEQASGIVILMHL